MTIQNPEKIGIGTGEWIADALQPIIDVGRAGFSWYYDWGQAALPGASPTQSSAAFTPMVWNAADAAAANLAAIKSAGATALLGFNEPDKTDQANMSVSQSLSLWPTLMATGLRLGSPAVTQNDVLGSDSWLARFMSGAQSRDYNVDFIAVHYYSSDQSVDNFRNWLEAVHNQYQKPIWVTEWSLADWNNPGRFSAAEQASFAQAGTEMMDSLPFVERQAWFAAYNGGDGWNLNSGIFDASGNLTPVGTVFRELNASSAQAASPVGNPTVPASNSGLVLSLSEDAYLGDAQYLISVDGQQVGGIRTATASHGAGQIEQVSLGALAAGQHQIGITFLNDKWDGTPQTDRNLYVDRATYDGQTVPGSSIALMSAGQQIFVATAPGALAPASGLVVEVAEDAYQGDAQFIITVDGHQVGGVQTATALHNAGQSQSISLGAVSPGAHQLGITFLNDAWGGTPETDRNLYVTGASYDGQAIPGGSATLYSAGTDSFAFTNGQTVTSDVVVNVSEDFYQGDAQFTIAVDGQQQGGVYTATAAHSAGQSQAIALLNILESFSPHDIAVTFLNDKWDGSPSTDRNLYINSIQMDGYAVQGGSAALMSAGTQHFAATAPANWTG